MITEEIETEEDETEIFSNKDAYSLILEIIKNEKDNYIPYHKTKDLHETKTKDLHETNTIMIRKLSDEQRFNNSKNPNFTIENTTDDLNTILQNGLYWLYDNIWKRNYIHGDLTSDNIILIKNQLYFIDWQDTTHHFHSEDDECLITIFILADIVDYLNSFYTSFDTFFTESIQILDFNDYYNIIKNIEYDIKAIEDDEDDELNNKTKQKCNNEYKFNKQKIDKFIELIKDKFNILIPPSSSSNLDIIPSSLGKRKNQVEGGSKGSRSNCSRGCRGSRSNRSRGCRGSRSNRSRGCRGSRSNRSRGCRGSRSNRSRGCRGSRSNRSRGCKGSRYKYNTHQPAFL
jgi:hypothetical protein